MKGHKVRQQRGFRIFTTKTGCKRQKHNQTRKSDESGATSGLAASCRSYRNATFYFYKRFLRWHL
ncbi:hypothetical protein [Cardiobacterium hominis]|uniref:hypothetical protein n=1 Tax=Cardiobacterium hominis TaxID=2718 RepID=UPI000A3E9775|nr:hypothetical protein [Cardiobacterium hominis]